ncbi:hypothetical protein NHJ13734_008200 [Beauveria thailandica]
MDGPIRTFTTSSTFPHKPSVNVIIGQYAYVQLQPTGNTPPLPAQLSIVHYFILFPSYSGNSLTYYTSTHTRLEARDDAAPPCSSPSPSPSPRSSSPRCSRFSSQKSAANGALCLVDAAADNPRSSPLRISTCQPLPAVLYTLAWNLGRPRREAHAAVACSSPGGPKGARRDEDSPSSTPATLPPGSTNQALPPYTTPEYALRPPFPFSGPLMALLLLRACRRRRSMLSEDPGVDGMLPAAVGRGQWRAPHVAAANGRDGPALAIVASPDDDDDDDDDKSLQKGATREGVQSVWMPGSGEACRVAKVGRLSRPSSSFNANLLLTNYLPTAFSTLVEPLWVLLGRFHYILWL